MSRNFAVATVATAPSPATTGTTLTVAPGHGARLFDGLAMVAPASGLPTPATAELVQVTVSGDTVTLVRARESSTARAVEAGDVLVQSVTAGMWDALVADVAGKADTVHAHSAADVTSGTLPLARGGTGAADAAGARAALGLGAAALAGDSQLLPAGGASGQVLTKTAAADFAVGWASSGLVAGPPARYMRGGSRWSTVFWTTGFNPMTFASGTGNFGARFANPARFANTFSADQIAIEVTGAAPSGAVMRLGLYADGGDYYPGALLADWTGATPIATSTTGVKAVSINTTFTAGALYWFAWSVEGGAATVRQHTVWGWPAFVNNNIAEAVNPVGRPGAEASGTAMAATWNGTGNYGGGALVMALRVV